MGPVNAVYNWSSVKALYTTVSSMNVAGLIAVVVAIVWAVRFARGFGDYLNLVSPGDGYVWMSVIISSAVLCSPAYILGLKSCLSLRMESSKADLEEEQKVDDLQRVANRLLFFHVIACLLSGFLVAVLNATYLALLNGFQQKSRDGLMQAIQKYGNDVTVKERVDAVQTEFECCGDSGYEDWFRVPWLKLAIEGPEQRENGPRLEEQWGRFNVKGMKLPGAKRLANFGDVIQSAPEDQEEEPLNTADVPFSCCSNDIPKPCVHHDILNPSAAYDYNPKHLTIATLGCRSKIIDRAATVRIFLSGYLAVLTVYQVTLSFLSRLLQTAHSNDLYIGPGKPRYRVWILFSPETTSSEAPLVKRNSSSSQPRKRSSHKPPPSPTSSSSSSEEEEIAPKAARKSKSKGRKMLDEIRSRISSAKSKSLPLIKSSISIANKLRVHRKDVHLSEDEVSSEGERGAGRAKRKKGEGREEVPREADRKRISEHATRSEVVVRRDYDSPGTSTDGASITEDFPPPPPPPPIALTFEIEQEDANKEKVVVNSFEEQMTASQNSGRRVKVLERFGRIEGRGEERNDQATQHGESGGADFSSSDRTSGSDRSKRVKFSPADVYDRFRGSLQHTLARREAVQDRKGSRRRAQRGRGIASLEARRSNLLARLGCKNVPPSYRLLANLEDRKRPTIQTHPPPTPPPFPQNPWTANCRKRQCSICHRPVQRSPASSRGSIIATPISQVAPPVAPSTNDYLGDRTRSRENYVPWNRSSTASRSILRR
ncbi:uncharacterized protein LOC143361348 [Halictus rubicundus]|uniref:uncharacterized protein LOC143361348 n=1 Tax=Halictus rubicundus TaxID=77578 RepID=UPI0040355522